MKEKKREQSVESCLCTQHENKNDHSQAWVSFLSVEVLGWKRACWNVISERERGRELERFDVSMLVR